MSPIRLTVVMTHPVQYYTPWFRHIAESCPELELQVVYATVPTPEQQGVGFGRAFTWDVPLLEGYRSRVVRAARPTDDLDSRSYRGLDVAEIAQAVRETDPQVALVPGWHSITLVRAMRDLRRLGVPVLYRGDTNLGCAPGGWRRPLWEGHTRLRLRMFDAYLSVGRRAREYLEHFGAPGTRIFASPHCVDNDFFRRGAAPFRDAPDRGGTRRKFGLGPEDFVVLFAGKLQPKKRPEDVIKAMSRLRGNVSLLVAGAGPREAVCRELAERLGVRVAWAGFLNQTELGEAFAAADCLALPSEATETWGLVVNEALATGLPCIVSDQVGCGPDLVVSGETGEIFPTADIDALASAIERIRDRQIAGHDFSAACQSHVARYSLKSATDGLLAACQATVPNRAGATVQPRVLACCGGMVIVGGLERMTFEVLRVFREGGVPVHCVVNEWENHRIVPLAESIGASWSAGHYGYGLTRRSSNPLVWASMGWNVLRSSAALLGESRRFRPTLVFVPDFLSVISNSPALLVFRAIGLPVILRVANHPERGRFYRRLWTWVVPALVSRLVANSHFSAGRLVEAGVPARKVATIRNAVARRFVRPEADADIVSLVRSRKTVLCVGQIAPFKGTHLVVKAARRLLDAGHDMQAVIVGAFPAWPPDLVEYFRALQEDVATSHRSDRIHFVGDRENVLEIMRASYVLAAPILQEETFGNVVLEAKSAGLPAVAFPTGGLVELIEHGVTGYLCPASTLESLVEGLEYFLLDGSRREQASTAGLAALARSDSDSSPAVFQQRWWSALEQTSRP